MISDNLTSLRKLSRMSQEEVAEKIGVSRQAVAKWESGATTPDINNCIELATLYGVSMDDLVNYTGKTNPGLIPPKGKHIFGVVSLGEKGQIIIPKKAREIFNLAPGDKIVILGDEERGIALAKADLMMHFYESLQGEYDDGQTQKEE